MRRILAILTSLAPFVAGTVAVLSPRRDVRILCMAAVATVVARVVMAVTPRARANVGAGAAFALAAVAAAAVAMMFGARAVFGIVGVAVVLAACAAAGAALGRRPASTSR